MTGIIIALFVLLIIVVIFTNMRISYVRYDTLELIEDSIKDIYDSIRDNNNFFKEYVNKRMAEINKVEKTKNETFQRYGFRWYLRHDLNPELIPDSFESEHVTYLENVGNIFRTKKDAERAAIVLKEYLMNELKSEQKEYKGNSKNKIKVIGQNFLHNHPRQEQILQIEKEHVIIDRDDWELVLKYFSENKSELNSL